MKKIALITGATAGIGEATARVLASNNFNVIITGRRINKLQNLQSEIESSTSAKVLPLCFDIQNFEDVKNAIDSLPESWRAIDVLVNNAGLAAGLEPIQSGHLADWEQMINTNVKGLLYMTRLVSPVMVERRTGHIVNIGSIAGKEVYSNGNVYCATKSAVDALTKAMRIDMLEFGIKVTAIHPGMVETEFSLVRFKGNSEKAKKVYDGVQPLTPMDVAEVILFAVTRPAHVNVDDLLLMPTCQASPTHVKREVL